MIRTPVAYRSLPPVAGLPGARGLIEDRARPAPAPPRLAVARAALAALAALAAVMTLAVWVPAAEAQDGATAPAGEPTGWYVVRPGDTLEEISRRYSGDSERWRQNWELNPQLGNPHQLEPGQRLQIYLRPEVPPETARLVQVARQVDKQPTPIPWEEAAVDDVLREADGVRTRRRSSAELAFTDGSHLRLTEGSLVFLRRAAGSQLVPVPDRGERGEVEIVEGQAELDRQPRPAAAGGGIDIVIGHTRAEPRGGENGEVRTRARRAEAGGAQLMVYEGESTVAAGGESVEVARGMGTTVAEGAPPAPPEKLLPAPRLIEPAGGAVFSPGRPHLRWQPVPETASYTAEVCADPQCGSLVARATGLAGPEWDPGELPVGELYWRATAVAASGLDGYPAAAERFEVTAYGDDTAPPAGRLAVTGRHLRIGERWVLGPDAGLAPEAEDDGSGVASWSYRLDGEAVERGALAGPFEHGEHSAEAVAVDRAGNRLQLGPLAFVSDHRPPQLTWSPGGPELLVERGHGRRDVQERRRRRGRPTLEWSSDGERWLPVRPPAGGSGEAGRITSDRPLLLLRATGRGPAFADGAPAPLPDDGLLLIEAIDEDSAVDLTTFGLLERPTEGPVFWLEVSDAVGNVRRVEWPLAEGSRR